MNPIGFHFFGASQVSICGFLSDVSVIIRYNAMKFVTDIHVPLELIDNDCVTSPLF